MASKPNLLKNQWGSVRPYTRHSAGCEVKDDSCQCSKWLYVNKRGEKPIQFSLVTPSWAEALERAADKLAELNPEIAEHRESKAKAETERKTVYEAVNLWLDRTRTKFGADSQILKQYRSTFGWVDKDGVKRGGMLLHAKENKLDYIDQFTPLVCQQWLSGAWFSGMTPYSRHQRWGTVRSFFNYLWKLGVLKENPVIAIEAPDPGETFANAPYTDAQYKAILDQSDWYVDDRVRNGEREVYLKRMHTFVELLRCSGMDIIDAVLFRPSEQLKDTIIDGQTVSVLRYSRQKTGVEAIIPALEPALVKMLREIPMAPKSVEGMPFRYKENDARSDASNWGKRIKKLIELADIKPVQLTGRDGRPAVDRFGNPITQSPNAKMLRHTFAVGELLKGTREEVVAKMLGHKSTEMIRKHYAPWCAARDDQHIREVMKNRKK